MRNLKELEVNSGSLKLHTYYSSIWPLLTSLPWNINLLSACWCSLLLRALRWLRRQQTWTESILILACWRTWIRRTSSFHFQTNVSVTSLGMSTSVPKSRARQTFQMTQPPTVARLCILARAGSTWTATREVGVGFRRMYTVPTTGIVTPMRLVMQVN